MATRPSSDRDPEELERELRDLSLRLKSAANDLDRLIDQLAVPSNLDELMGQEPSGEPTDPDDTEEGPSGPTELGPEDGSV